MGCFASGEGCCCCCCWWCGKDGSVEGTVCAEVDVDGVESVGCEVFESELEFILAEPLGMGESGMIEATGRVIERWEVQ